MIIAVFSCEETSKSNTNPVDNPPSNMVITGTSVIVLGTVQDAGSPHIACTKACCQSLFKHPDPNRKVVSLGLVDPANHKNFIFDATPDLPEQMKILKKYSSFSDKETPDGIFLTHAHIGHYTGLMYFGKEAMYAKGLPIYAMPRLKTFLELNGPWSLLVKNKNISLHELSNNLEIQLSANLQVIPFLVPHRDEYSETVGYTIIGPSKRALFIPDIDKWEKWNTDIIEAISNVDYAFIDGTFYDGEEINHRDISEIPHPFIIESMKIFSDLSVKEKHKIYFIHLNHTNPALNLKSAQARLIIENEFNIAKMFDVFKL